MSEYSTPQVERKLWYEGANYTADAVIIDPATAQILLIQRRDTGEWALPGGFVDPDDPSPRHAAQREAYEEAGITLNDECSLVFRGIVDDPRNTEDAWIETSAYVFMAANSSEIHAGDDASDFGWYSLDDIPQLYASHRSIVERAIDHHRNIVPTETLRTLPRGASISGGHMEYGKYIVKDSDVSHFVKCHEASRFSDPERAERSRAYLEKEAAVMAHLRFSGFTNLPARSALQGNLLTMQAFAPEDGWQWRAEEHTIDAYVQDAIETFSRLETTPIHPDTFDIDPSYESFNQEGWKSFDATTTNTLTSLSQSFMSRLRPESQTTARALIADLDDLRHVAARLAPAEQFVFCHHDMRQSNLAWHSDYGTKLIDWSWAGLGEPGSDRTSLLIDLHKSGHDVSRYEEHINPNHCLKLIGFWLGHSMWPHRGDDTVRFQQFVSALSAYEILKKM